MRTKHKLLTNQTDHSKTYLFSNNPLTLVSIILLVTMIGCGKGNKNNDDNDTSSALVEKKTLKFQLTAPAQASSKTQYKIGADEDLLKGVAINTEVDLFKFTVAVTEGNDVLENYQFKVLTQICFAANNFTGNPPANVEDYVTLSKPTHNIALKDAGLGSALKQGDKKEISFSFKGGKGQGNKISKIKTARSAQADIQVVDKNGVPVSNTVTLYWHTDEA